MGKLFGTSVVKLSTFLDNLKDMAGTCYLTRLEYDNNPSKVCSYSHINSMFFLTWNDALELAKLPIKRRLQTPITQGRKLKDRSRAKLVECLTCEIPFMSIDPKMNRVCRKCKDLKNFDED